ncbi:MAG: chemotaxis protein CheW [bacterium]|nr:chemotaxis protein CheW [bacterium]
MAIRQIVVFFLENKRYGVEIENINDIYEKMDAVRVPNSDDFIDGIINLRGDVVTLVNLKKRLRIDRSKQEENIIICEMNKDKFGLTVDAIDGIIRLEKNENETQTDSGFIKGFIEKNGKQIIIIDLKRILTKN